MSIIRSINISMELWGFILIVFVLWYFLKEKKAWTNKNRAFLHLAICQGVLLISSSVGFIFEGNPSYLHHHIVSVCNFIAFEASYVMVFFLTNYITANFKEKVAVSKWPLRINVAIVAVATVLLLVSQANRMFYYINFDSYYVRGALFFVPALFVIAGLFVNIIYLLIYRKHIEEYEKWPLFLCVLLPMVATFIQICTKHIALLNIAYTISLLIISIYIQMNHERQRQAMERKLIRQDTELAESHAKLAEARIDLMRSQIQPHFIFNTLGTIESLCHVDPEKSAEIIHEFALYLRGNFDELESKAPISLTREIEHVKHYTAIENVRFPDMKIYYDLKSVDFLLPALSIQPLVENAIKHGLMGLVSGGSVVISTYETDDKYCVSVKDNGVGFDVNAPLPKTGRKHLGIKNIQERLWAMCNGTLNIESTPGKGTLAVIAIPKR